MDAKCLHVESDGGNRSGAVQGISCHISFVGEASAAGAADPKPHRRVSAVQPRQKNKLPQSRAKVCFVVNETLPDVETKQRPCGLMDKALVFGTKDCRFESCQGHTPF